MGKIKKLFLFIIPPVRFIMIGLLLRVSYDYSAYKQNPVVFIIAVCLSLTVGIYYVCYEEKPQPDTHKNTGEAPAPAQPQIRKFSPAIERLISGIEKKGMQIAFGLEQQGHIPYIEKALETSGCNEYTWEKIGKHIGWCPKTASYYYIKYLKSKLKKQALADAGFIEFNGQQILRARIISIRQESHRVWPYIKNIRRTGYSEVDVEWQTLDCLALKLDTGAVLRKWFPDGHYPSGVNCEQAMADFKRDFKTQK